MLNVPGKYKLSTRQLKERGVVVSVNGGLVPDLGASNPNYSIRLGIHYYNNKEDIDRLFAAIEDCCMG